MSIYLATFGKLRYLGLLNLTDSSDAASEAVNDRALVGKRWILLGTMRGLEMGRLAGRISQKQAQVLARNCTQESNGEHLRGPEPILQEVDFAGFAEPQDIEEYHRCRLEEEDVLRRSREILTQAHNLEMKLVDTEYMLDRRKLFFYFTSEQRIDFRAYVRDLAREFKTRIEMRQIGVRDEARTVEGISPCGRPCCCGYWLHHFEPIGIRMVKEQKLALNPTKISGICGRLMCCMAYEYENYEELWRNLPGPGAKLRAPQGVYILDSVDLDTEEVRIRYPSGQIAPVPIAKYQEFQERVLRGDEPVQPPSRETSVLRAGPRAGVTARGLAARGPIRSRLRAFSNARANAKPEKPDKLSLDEHLALREREREREQEREQEQVRGKNVKRGDKGRGGQNNATHERVKQLTNNDAKHETAERGMPERDKRRPKRRKSGKPEGFERERGGSQVQAQAQAQVQVQAQAEENRAEHLDRGRRRPKKRRPPVSKERAELTARPETPEKRRTQRPRKQGES